MMCSVYYIPQDNTSDGTWLSGQDIQLTILGYEFNFWQGDVPLSKTLYFKLPKISSTCISKGQPCDTMSH